MRLSHPLPWSPLSRAWLFVHEAGVWKYHAALVVFTLLIAARKIATVQLLAGVDSLYMTFATSVWVLLFALLSRLALYGTTVNYPVREQWLSLVALGLGTSAGMIGSIMALQYISPTLDSLLSLVLYSLSVSIFAWLFGRGEVVRFGTLLPIIGVAGVGIVIFSLDDLRHTNLTASMLGYFWSVVGIVGWAVSIVAVTNMVRLNVPIVDAIAIRFLTPTVVLLPYLLVTGRLHWDHRLLEMGLVAALTYFIPFLISFSAVRKLSVITFAISTMTTPVVVYALSVLLLGAHPLTLLQWLGGAIIFGAVGYRMLREVPHGTTRRMTVQLLEKLRA